VLRTALTLSACLIPLQILVGDLHGLNTVKYQPAKVAAMEGVWNTEYGAPMLLFAWPNEAEKRNDFEVGIPKLASLILTHEAQGKIQGLNEFKDAHPPVKPIFFAFRVMVGVGMLMLLTSWVGLWFYRRKKWSLQDLPRPLLWALSAMTFSGWVATLAGWYVTEIGRQPFVVYGFLRTQEVASKVPPSMIALSLGLYVGTYLILIVAYIATVKHLAEKKNMPLTPTVQAHTAPNSVQHSTGLTA
jgi:cytochrome bd ubiquinol oxidase subunit I